MPHTKAQAPLPPNPAAPASGTVAEPPEPAVRDWLDRRATEQARKAAHARQASGRRRLVDPATCDRDYSAEELEFMQAMQKYKQQSGRMFPTWSEVLEVLRGLGYEKAAAAPPLDFDSLAAPGQAQRVASA
jgi:hypothetical protein